MSNVDFQVIQSKPRLTLDRPFVYSFSIILHDEQSEDWLFEMLTDINDAIREIVTINIEEEDIGVDEHDHRYAPIIQGHSPRCMMQFSVWAPGKSEEATRAKVETILEQALYHNGITERWVEKHGRWTSLADVEGYDQEVEMTYDVMCVRRSNRLRYLVEIDWKLG